MFNLFPQMVVPVSIFTPVKNVIQGNVQIDISSKTLIGVDTSFTKEVRVGSQLSINDNIIGVVGNVIDDSTIILEDVPLNTTSGTFSLTVTNYNQSSLGKPVEFTDIFVRVRVIERYVKNTAALIPYTVKEGETPEFISKIFYGTAFYHWIIILINNIINPREEWPLTEVQLTEKIRLLYPNNNKDDVFYYRETDTGYIVEYDVNRLAQEEIYPVTIYEHEFEMNEKKRQIKILDPVFIPQFIFEFTSSLK